MRKKFRITSYQIIIVVGLLGLHTNITGQSRDYNHIHNKADSLVRKYWGEENFRKYITLDKTKSEYLFFRNMWEKKSKFNQNLDFVPNTYLYKYKVNHRLFDNLEYPIQFYLDSLGKLMVGFDPNGLIAFKDLESPKIISKKVAIAIAKKSGISIGKKKLEIELIWFQNPENLWSGYVWSVISYLDKPYRQGCFYHEAEAMYVDIRTGKVVGNLK